jgi:outer membrane protein OmpA-like peptidoglycan-associated protein
VLRSFALAKMRLWLCAFVWVFIVTTLVDAQESKASLDENVLRQNQATRDDLFKKLKAAATKYTFDYVVIYLPPGTVPGMNFPIPVSHVRYKSTVFFAFNRYDLDPNAEQVLSDLSEVILKDRTLRSLLVVGHTDAVGSNDYNAALSLKRAATVASRLNAGGTKDEYIGVIPMGKAQPISTNKTSEGRAQNRRVEFFISDVPEATIKAIERIPFNPCFRNDNDGAATDCDKTVVRIPIYPGSSGRSRPRFALELQGAPSERSRLPTITLERPSIQKLEEH